MLGRHNITLYADELERCMGDARRLVDGAASADAACYWLGALNTLTLLWRPDMPDDHVAMVAALGVHFTIETENGNETEEPNA